jgi:hypothetical protein
VAVNEREARQQAQVLGLGTRRARLVDLVAPTGCLRPGSWFRHFPVNYEARLARALIARRLHASIGPPAQL